MRVFLFVLGICVFCGAGGIILLTSGCDTGYGCAAGVYPAVIVRVTDATTGESLTDGANGTVQDGDFVEELHPHERVYDGSAEQPGAVLSLAGAVGRTGDYTVRVTRPGYKQWEQSGIRIRSHRCDFDTARLEARLERTEQSTSERNTIQYRHGTCRRQTVCYCCLATSNSSEAQLFRLVAQRRNALRGTNGLFAVAD